MLLSGFVIFVTLTSSASCILVSFSFSSSAKNDVAVSFSFRFRAENKLPLSARGFVFRRERKTRFRSVSSRKKTSCVINVTTAGTRCVYGE